MTERENSWWGQDVLDRRRWGEVIEEVGARLLRARERDLLPHALLLVGPPGLGRELAALELSVLLVCEGAVGLWHDDRCADRIRRGVHPDVEAVMPRGAKQLIVIDQIREIVKSASGRPYEGERRVWILDGVEHSHFGPNAANAFLKVLEEPPPHVVFILLAANPDAVLSTIRSRCQQVALPGAVALARRDAADAPLPELAASSMAGHDVVGAADAIRAALAEGLMGESGSLVRIPYAIPDGVPPFAATAAVALEMAGERETESCGEDLAILAADLLAVERRSRALNLNARAQLVSCLLRWYRELAE